MTSDTLVSGRADARHSPDLATLRARLVQTGTQRKDTPDDTADAIMTALAWHARGRAVSTRLAAALPWPTLDAAATDHFQRLAERCIAGEPVAYLTGRQHFLGLEMRVAPGALIPRKETELLARRALERWQHSATDRSPAILVDLCAGVGNIAAVLAEAAASRDTPARVIAADLSTDALALARVNLASLGLAGRVELRDGDLFGALIGAVEPGQIDLIACNPPYLSDTTRSRLPASIGAHEPSLAFDGGPLGIRILNRLIREAPDWLAPAGALLVEVGAGQGAGFIRRIESDPRWRSVTGHPDDDGQIRVIEATRA